MLCADRVVHAKDVARLSCPICSNRNELEHLLSQTHCKLLSLCLFFAPRLGDYRTPINATVPAFCLRGLLDKHDCSKVPYLPRALVWEDVPFTGFAYTSKLGDSFCQMPAFMRMGTQKKQNNTVKKLPRKINSIHLFCTGRSQY